jgi:hypothetical protein
MPDAAFCRKCGRRRPEQEDPDGHHGGLELDDIIIGDASDDELPWDAMADEAILAIPATGAALPLTFIGDEFDDSEGMPFIPGQADALHCKDDDFVEEVPDLDDYLQLSDINLRYDDPESRPRTALKAPSLSPSSTTPLASPRVPSTRGTPLASPRAPSSLATPLGSPRVLEGILTGVCGNPETVDAADGRSPHGDDQVEDAFGEELVYDDRRFLVFDV